MKKLTSFLSLLFLTISLFGQALPKDCYPLSDNVEFIDEQHSEWFVLGFDADTRCPLWAAYKMTDEMAEASLSPVIKRPSNFTVDKHVGSANTKDYTNSGYSRGHMVPFDHFDWNATAGKQTFIMSNICPQLQTMNNGNWKKIESQMIGFAKKYGIVYRVCGPIFDEPDKIETLNNKGIVGIPLGFYNVYYLDGFYEACIVWQDNTIEYFISIDDIFDLTGILLPEQIVE
ncbi:MAG: DNA/RNA non-specific endonuclease [Clostridia bacterium]|nr:DNA/RNA non-specific endonuclease [Clostridia bacterium]